MADHDLAALWDAHYGFEFDARGVDATMATMGAQPSVNHIPTRFERVAVSRTVGESSVVRNSSDGALRGDFLDPWLPSNTLMESAR